jgi:DNA mismatch repair protein MutS2
MKEKLDAQMKEFTDRKNTIIADAREEARATLSNANSLIENAIREIKAGASKDQVKEMRRSIEEARSGMKAPTGTKTPQTEGFAKGDTVRIKGGTQIGELEFDPDEKGNVVVQYGALRMRSHVDELESVTRKEARTVERAGRQAVVNPTEAQSRLDLRGMYGDEAVIQIEQAITGAMNANMTMLEIIHGKGTGALRRRIHEYLATHPGVNSYRLGALTEGGAGVTIVELK